MYSSFNGRFKSNMKFKELNMDKIDKKNKLIYYRFLNSITKKIKPHVASLMFGEACSSVPVFKKKSFSYILYHAINHFICLFN